MIQMPELTYRNRPAQWEGDLEDKLGYDRPEWRKRIVALSSFITDEDKSVMDLGAGHMHLRRILNKDVLYYPVDYKKNTENTIVCNFNKGEFPEKEVDVICAAGILEYIEDPVWFLKQVTSHCRKLLLSYKGRERYEYIPLYSEEIIVFLNAEGFGITGRDDSFDEWTLLACFERIMPETLGFQLACTGCGCCRNICPVDAIKMQYESDGYLKPAVDKNKCINCGICVKACSALHCPVNELAYKKPLCYAAWANDNIRKKSSSGGFFSVLSEYVINKGGSIFGALWEKDFYCGIHKADSICDITPMRYSKYVQSNTHETYREVKKLLTEGKLTAYFGCPCQIAGLKSYLNNSGDDSKQNDNLITVDLICFCAPSNVYFRKYLDENYGLENVVTVNFRDKSDKMRWSPVSYGIKLKSGEILYPGISNDRYQMAFHNVLARNDTCEKCDYYKMPRQGDFSIGDFWGIEAHVPSWNDGKGTSLVLVNDRKAEEILKEILDKFSRIEEVPLEYFLKKGNRVDDSARKGHLNKEYFQDMVTYMPFNQAVDDALSNHHDIGMVCALNLNIGNNLTNYALYQVLSDKNFRTLVIGNPVDKASYNGKDERFSRFLRLPYNRYDIAPICFHKTELYRLNDICDLFVVGSDQLFRKMFVEDMDYYTCLDWVYGTKYKMSYGTSFGCLEFEGSRQMQSKMSYLLNRFSCISVREESSVELLKDLFGCRAERVLDPVFLCDIKYYTDMIKIGKLRVPEEKFTGAYLLDITEEKKKVVQYISNLFHNEKHQVITDYPEYYFEDDINILHEPAIEEWLAMIAECDFFVTDSFHGVCFAIIFQKQFCVVFDQENWRGYIRIQDILERFGLQDRFFTKFDEKMVSEICGKDIDYEWVNCILKEEKEKSMEWLSHALAGRKDFTCNYDVYDALLEQMIGKYKRDLDTQNSIQKKIRKIRSDYFLAGHKAKNGNKRISKVGREPMQVVGFGAGGCFERNKEMIRKVYDIKYVCDNSPAKWGELGDGIMCISPKQLSEMSDVLVVIMVDNIKIAFDIVEELESIGIYNYTHIENWITAMEQ